MLTFIRDSLLIIEFQFLKSTTYYLDLPGFIHEVDKLSYMSVNIGKKKMLITTLSHSSIL